MGTTMTSSLKMPSLLEVLQVDLEVPEIIMTKIRNLCINKHKGRQVGSHCRQTMLAALIKRPHSKVPTVEHSLGGLRWRQKRIAAKKHLTIRVLLKQKPNGPTSYSLNLKDINKSL
jgi:hypothetical protein